MKRINLRITWMIPALLFSTIVLHAQDEKPELTLNLAYHVSDNKLPYLKIGTQIRKEKTIEAVKGARVSIYLDEESDEALVAKVVTDEAGRAKAILPVSLKTAWDSSYQHTFIAVSSPTDQYAETRTETEVVKARLQMDTTRTEEGAKALTVTVFQFDGVEWKPVPEVEVKIGVRRLGGILPVSEEESYTTDSTGVVMAEFKRDSLPAADRKGAITLVARVEDHETLGNLSLDKSVPWGVYQQAGSRFGHRTLWATRDKTPLWLLAMATSIVIGVWSVLIYLVFQLVKIVKLGRHSTLKKKEEELVV